MTAPCECKLAEIFIPGSRRRWSKDPVADRRSAYTPTARLPRRRGDALAAPELGAAAIRAALERSGIAGDAVNEIVFGCVLSAGQGQAPARQAALGAELPISVGATTVNKMCGSGMKAVMLARDQILSGGADVIVAGGMEKA